jgi:hypothetical protein
MNKKDQLSEGKKIAITVFGETLQMSVLSLEIDPTCVPENSSKVTRDTEITIDTNTDNEETKDTTLDTDEFVFKEKQVS